MPKDMLLQSMLQGTSSDDAPHEYCHRGVCGGGGGVLVGGYGMGGRGRGAGGSWSNFVFYGLIIVGICLGSHHA